MLFEEQITRKPDLYPWTEEFMRAMWDGHWTDKEFNFQGDIQDFKVKLTKQEREIIVRTLSAIGQIEIAVKTFWAKLGDNLPHPSIRDMGYVMANVECFSFDTEILTPNGWKFIKDVQIGDDVYQFNNDSSLSVTKILNVNNKLYKGLMYEFGDKSNNCFVTPNHDMIVQRKKVSGWKIERVKSCNVKSHSALKFPRGAKITGGKDDKLTPFEKICIAIQADGTVSKQYLSDGSIVPRGNKGGYTHQIRLIKKRKIDRLLSILKESNITYSIGSSKMGDSIFYITMPRDFSYEDFSWVNLSDKTSNWCREFVEELFHWDGCLKSRGYYSKHKENVDFCQHVGILAGFNTTTGQTKDNRNPKNSIKHRVMFSSNINLWRHSINGQIKTVDYDGVVYCVTVESGMIMTRRNGKTFITGNCIHNSAYERLLEVLGLESVFEENLKLDWIIGRVNYLRKYTHRYYNDNKKQFIYSLILFTLFVENVSLFSQFYIINWFGRKNLLKDTNQQTSYTLREELLHSLIGVKLINVLKKEYPDLFDKDLEDKILSEAAEAFKAEEKIIDWMVNGINEEYLSAPILKEFVKERINSSLNQIGYKNIFDINNDLIQKTNWFNEEIYGNGQTDFFHSRPVEYAKKAQSFSEQDIF